MLSYSRKDLIHWNYFIAIERDLETLSRYIEFSHANEPVYSIELAKLLMAASAEVDVLCKMLCKELGTIADSINKYRKCIQTNRPEMAEEQIFINRFSINSRPWLNWRAGSEKKPD